MGCVKIFLCVLRGLGFSKFPAKIFQKYAKYKGNI